MTVCDTCYKWLCARLVDSSYIPLNYYTIKDLAIEMETQELNVKKLCSIPWISTRGVSDVDY